MGRVKLKIKKLENTNSRHITYAKRKHGILKKANELSILCDVSIVLLMFSPTGKPSLCCGKQSVEEVIAKFSKLTPQERAKRKLESLEVLKKTFKKLDHVVNIPEILGTSNPKTEDLINQARLLRNRLSETQKKLSYWTEPEKINSIEDLGQMENSLRESLDEIRARKENLQQRQPISPECKHPNGTHVSFGMGAEQQLHNFSWIPNDETRSLAIPEDQISVPHRDMEVSASSSLGSCSGFFSTVKGAEIYSPVKEPVHSEPEGTTGLQAENTRYSFLPYNLSFLAEKIQELEEWNLLGTPADYHVGRILEASGTQFGLDRSFASLFDEPLFSKLRN